MPFTSTWSSRQHPTAGKIYERPLGLTELGFYWATVLNRTADTLHHAEIDVQSGIPNEIIDLQRISGIWMGLKQEFPLLGASLEERDRGSVYFVVDQEHLSKHRETEVTLEEIASADEATLYARQLVTSHLILSNQLLASLVILKRTDKKSFHVLIHLAHCITDGVGNISLLKTFLDRLSRPPIVYKSNLEDRLGISTALEGLVPQRLYSPAKRRWREAMAFVIDEHRTAKLRGGHTLPRNVSPATAYIPAKSSWIACSLSEEISAKVIQNCRKNGFTFGSAYPVLSQVALTRVLLRLYLRGEITQEEWDFRRREPMLTAGPINLRPFLDRDWLESGGKSNVCLSIAFYFYHLPFMPLGSCTLSPGMKSPDLQAMFSQERFYLRCKRIKAQADQYLKHPLFTELALARLPRRAEKMAEAASKYRHDKVLPARPLSVLEQASQGFVVANGGSSMGDIDSLLPKDFPVPYSQNEGPPSLHLVNSETHLHCRPAELYLGASTFRGHLRFHVFWDENVYQRDTITEWLEEVKAAAEFYLG